MIKLELTPQQALNLRQLLDVAVRANGMTAALVALPIDAVIVAAATLADQDDIVARAKEIEAGRAAASKETA